MKCVLYTKAGKPRAMIYIWGPRPNCSDQCAKGQGRVRAQVRNARNSGALASGLKTSHHSVALRQTLTLGLGSDIPEPTCGGNNYVGVYAPRAALERSTFVCTFIDVHSLK